MTLLSKVFAGIVTISTAILTIANIMQPKSYVESYSYTPNMNIDNYTQAKQYVKPRECEQVIEYSPNYMTQPTPVQNYQPIQDSRRNISNNTSSLVTYEYDPWGDERIASYILEESRRTTSNNCMNYNNAQSQYYAQQYNNANRSLQTPVAYPSNNYNGYCGNSNYSYGYGYAATTPVVNQYNNQMYQPNAYDSLDGYKNYNTQPQYYNNYPSYPQQNYPQQNYQNQYYGMNGYSAGYQQYPQQSYPQQSYPQQQQSNNKQYSNSFINELFDNGNSPYINNYNCYPQNNVQQYQPNTMNNNNQNVTKYASFNIDEVQADFIESIQNPSSQTCGGAVVKDYPSQSMNNHQPSDDNSSDEVNINMEAKMNDLREIMAF